MMEPMHVKVCHVGKMEETWLSRFGVVEDVAKLRERGKFLLPLEGSQHSLQNQWNDENGS